MINYQSDIEDIIEQFNKCLLNNNKIRLDEVFIDSTKYKLILIYINFLGKNLLKDFI